ncbi:rho GTPase-activating protein 15-like [Cetorhinus maximus]
MTKLALPNRSKAAGEWEGTELPNLHRSPALPVISDLMERWAAAQGPGGDGRELADHSGVSKDSSAKGHSLARSLTVLHTPVSLCVCVCPLPAEEKLNMDDPEWEDVHVITGALKMFFRELPEPLFPYDAFEGFVSAVKLPDHSERLENVKNLVQNLPRSNRDTMETMFKHMKKVAEHSHLNRMTAQSLAIVFGPTLLRPEKDFLNMAVHMVYQNQIVELILLEYHTVFASGRELL